MAEDNGNGKVTIALLGQRMDSMEKKIDAILAEMRTVTDCYHTLDKEQTAIKSDVEKNGDEINRLRGSSNVKDFVISIGVIISTFLGVNK